MRLTTDDKDLKMEQTCLGRFCVGQGLLVVTAVTTNCLCTANMSKQLSVAPPTSCTYHVISGSGSPLTVQSKRALLKACKDMADS